MKLNHIDIPVSDISGARRFFEDHFGFRCTFEREDGLTVLLDEIGFALTLSAVPAGEKLSYPTGFHVGFILREKRELMRSYEQLSTAGVEIVRPLADLGGAPTFQCNAPGPILVEVSWRPVN